MGFIYDLKYIYFEGMYRKPISQHLGLGTGLPPLCAIASELGRGFCPIGPSIEIEHSYADLTRVFMGFILN